MQNVLVLCKNQDDKDKLKLFMVNLDTLDNISDEIYQKVLIIFYSISRNNPVYVKLINKILKYILINNNDKRLMTPTMYNLLLSNEQHKLISEYEKINNCDIISSYEMFVTFTYTSHLPIRINHEYSDRILLKHKDYFLRLLREEPFKCIEYGYIFRLTNNTEIHEFVYDNIAYDERIIHYSEGNANYFSSNGNYHIKFIPYLEHYHVLNMILFSPDYKIEITILEYFYKLHSKFDKIVLEIGIYSAYNRIRYFKEMMTILIHEERVIKQAKNYYPPAYNDITNFDDNLTQKDIELVRFIKLWKLNLARMFAFRNNLDTLCFVEFEKLK